MTTFIEVNQQKLAVDKEGYLEDLDDWSAEVAAYIAAEASVILGDEHWEIIQILRAFYQLRNLSPPMRVMVRLVKNELGADKGNSLYLLRLFPDSPAKLAAKIAGLPRPTNCL